MSDFPARLARVRARIEAAASACGRDARQIHSIGVTKLKPAGAVAEALDAGLVDIGENFVQEALEKMAALGARQPTWHFIGALQSNKTRQVAENFDWVHSVDRLKIARRLSEQRPEDAPPLQVGIQVHLGSEASKSGASPGDVPALARAIRRMPRLRFRGLMAVPPPETDLERQRHWFRELAELAGVLRAETCEVDTLSMGMSDDLEAAIAEGATHVRIGTALFGPRPRAEA